MERPGEGACGGLLHRERYILACDAEKYARRLDAAGIPYRMGIGPKWAFVSATSEKDLLVEAPEEQGCVISGLLNDWEQIEAAIPVCLYTGHRGWCLELHAAVWARPERGPRTLKISTYQEVERHILGSMPKYVQDYLESSLVRPAHRWAKEQWLAYKASQPE